MAVSIDTTSEAANNVTSVSSVTWAHTCSTNTTMLNVQTGFIRVGGGITGITYNSVALTAAVTSNPGNNVYAALWYLMNPTTGSSQNIVVSYTDSSTFEPKNGATSFLGTQTTFTGATATGGTASDSGTHTVNITTNSNNSYIVSAFESNGGTPSTADTQLWIDVNGAGGADGGASYKTTTTAGSYSMTWNGSGSDNWATAIMEIVEAATTTQYRRLASLGVGQ